MTTMTQPRQQNGAQQQAPPLSAALEQVLAATVPQKFKALDDALSSAQRIEQIENLLPPNMKGQAARLAKRAILTLNRKADHYAKVTPQSFVRCVLEAAELGLAIDGRLAHAVVFNNKVKVDGREQYISEAQLMVDYKGLIAVARRTGIIADCYARLVHEADVFHANENDGVCHLRHEQCFGAGDRGKLLGVYAVIKFPDGGWRFELMDTAEVDAIRGRSKSWKGGTGFGPWKTDDGEMRKKTVLRRILKTYIDDPAFTRALEIDDQDYQDAPLSPLIERTLALPLGKSRIRDIDQQPPPGEEPQQHPEEASQEPPAGLDEIHEPETPVGADELADDLRGRVDECKTPKEFAQVHAVIDQRAGDLGILLHRQLLDRLEQAHRARK